jgi:hypothetical protein
MQVGAMSWTAQQAPSADARHQVCEIPRTEIARNGFALNLEN